MLYIVPTPIGNLEDITIRAIKILKKSNLILVENIYKSKILLNHYNIKSKIKKYNIYNEHKILIKIIFFLKLGKIVSLITDAGTPLISDPGFLLVRECIKNNIYIECLPGPTAFIPALIQSGFPINKFFFLGFISKKKKEIKNIIKNNYTIVFYESPHRLLNTLKILKKFLKYNRKIVICKELTKKFQEIFRGNIKEILIFIKKKKIKGEFVIIII